MDRIEPVITDFKHLRCHDNVFWRRASDGKESLQCGRPGFDPWVGKNP